MLVSTKGRYALRVMIDLAEHQAQGRIPLKDIAARQEVSEKYLENILSVLVRSNLLAGMRGKGGGYTLMVPPDQIRVGQVLRITEGSLAPVSCLDNKASTSPADAPMQEMWAELDHLINDYLDGITIADLVAKPRSFDYVI
ncbi:Rrf2 family transcriptional regulator [Collinsella sp. zg1085]|uniref:RrF2 family transcriptional regulator n=1 Tax=Collinsella sp. zg1085 TaxID=2844380 RepID=UPI001C0C1A29|nr:Rrf2 family transcriptional regulator [Collinsella sp. zg1085]QWT17248.1 Rrf2 family transcriptional regulator [Collinsella sp. zg1085]